LNTSPWRSSARLRKLAELTPPRFRRLIRDATKLLWWSVTFRLKTKLHELRVLNSLFDEAWYLRTYPDVAAARIDPFSHYLSNGATEGRDPGPKFSTSGYLAHYPDVASAGVNPLLHYVQFGRAEGREITPAKTRARRSNESKSETLDGRLIDLCRDFSQRLGPLSKFDDQSVDGPLISILLPLYKTPISILDKTIMSVSNQSYQNWELCLVDDGSALPPLRRRLNYYQRKDQRIRATFRSRNEGISAATNAALEMAKGKYVAFLDHDDMLTNDALHWVAVEITNHPDTDLLYSDECKIDSNDVPSRPFVKPDWSPILLLNSMYTAHFMVIRRSLLVKLGGVRQQYDFSQDYDLALRVSEVTTAVRHVRRILYGWRCTPESASAGGKPYARKSNIAALQDALNRRGVHGTAIALPHTNRVVLDRREIKGSVSIIIPSDNEQNIRKAFTSIIGATSYAETEIIVVTSSALIGQLDAAEFRGVQFVPFNLPFNFSAKCNRGAEAAKGKYLIFFNDDVRVISPNWIEELLECFVHGKVGAVGPKLLYENGTIQHAGMITGVRRLVGTAFHALPSDSTSMRNIPQWVREVSLLSGACLLVPRDLFFEIGGFDEDNTPIAHSDVDFCLRLGERGYRCIYTPHATLRHIGHHSLRTHDTQHNPRSRKPKNRAAVYLLRQWSERLAEDPHFPPSLRDVAYADSPAPFRLFPSRRFPVQGGRNIVLIAHELSWSGAPRNVFFMAQALRENGDFVVVIAPRDGPYRQMLQQLGVPVVVDELLFRADRNVYEFILNFDLAVAQTMLCWRIVLDLGDSMTICWNVRESLLVPELCQKEPRVARAFSKARSVWAVSQRSADLIRPFYPDPKVIVNGYDPIDRAPRAQSPTPPFVVSLFGSYEPRKGQDIALAALKCLPEDYLRKIQLQMFGRVLNKQFFESLQMIAAKMPHVAIHGEISPDNVITEMLRSDIVLAPSRDDALCNVALDALRTGTVLVVTPNAGVHGFITEGTSGYVAQGTPPGIAAALMRAIDDARHWDEIGQSAQTLFHGALSLQAFNQRVIAAAEDAMNGGHIDD